jgi:amino acid adenylation domain-containing protein
LHISETRQEYFSWDQPPNLIHPPESLPFIPAGFEYNEWTSRLFRGAGPATFSLVGEVACLDRFKLKLSVQRCENDLKATILFDSSFISAQNVQRIARYFCTLAQNAISRSGAPIYDLDFLEEEEAKYLIHALNQTKSDYERDICIHELFERQSEQFPDRVAVVGESERLTYRDLNRRANQLAHRLRRMGVGPESKVALCAERSVGFIVGLLGVLKAGGAYIPMDLQTPAARLAYMIKDAGAGIVLTQRAFRALFEGQGRSVICLDSPEEGLEEESAQNPGLQVAPANLAYLIYTSGSTGEPKAVAVEHRQIANYLQSVVQRLELPSGASYALVSTVAADLGNTSIFPALCYGGCLHVISQSIAADPECLAEYFRRHQPDCLKIAPSHLTAMLCASGPADVLPKRRLIFGGEASSWAMADRIKALAPALRIFNHYGPTETTVGVLTNPVNPSAAKRWTAQVPLGRPISNTQVYILDAWLRPAPMGISGEVFIGGENVSRGYLNRPDASAERFIPDPFAVAPGSRMYRTGDLARYLPDGTLEFLGRSDHQIKIRGHRVELREVEAALLHHQAVREAVVVANQDAADEGRLVAYWIGRPNLSATVAELREALRQRMPEYMVPSFFVKLDAWPLNPNGKIDRKALPRPNLQASDPDKGYVAPRSDAEKTIARIWRDVLRVERVGLYNNFFDLGGHSLLMVQVHSKLRETFSREISMMDMFKYTTVGTLAGYLSVGQTDPTSHIYGETRAQIRQAALQQRGEYRETR